jgi:hypothetical protein
MEKLIEELKKTKKKSYKYLAKRLQEASITGNIPRNLKRECMIILVNELEKYENDELINQLLLFVGKPITNEEKANRK